MADSAVRFEPFYEPRPGTRKIAELATPAQIRCRDAGHNPPHKLVDPGFYRHECPACGLVQYFKVHR